jgi:hypothetical protein
MLDCIGKADNDFLQIESLIGGNLRPQSWDAVAHNTCRKRLLSTESCRL